MYLTGEQTNKEIKGEHFSPSFEVQTAIGPRNLRGEFLANEYGVPGNPAIFKWYNTNVCGNKQTK